MGHPNGPDDGTDFVRLVGEETIWRAERPCRRAARGGDEGRGVVRVEGEEGGESPAARYVPAGSLKNCSCSFSEFQL